MALKIKNRLTRKQKRLIKELDEIMQTQGLDYWNIARYEKEARTPTLESIKREVIKGVVVDEYTLIDEYLNMVLCNYFFGKKRSYQQLWRTKKFKTFNYILEELHLMQKLRFVKEVIKIPRAITKTIELKNSVRNAVAHSFFPENLKRYKAVYKGKDIFSLEGLRLYKEDMRKVIELFVSVI